MSIRHFSDKYYYATTRTINKQRQKPNNPSWLKLSKLTYEEKAKFCEEAALICEHNRRILTRRKNFNYKMNY